VELKPDRRRWGGALDRGHYFGALSSTSAIDRGFFGQAATSHGRGNTVVGSCTAARHVMTKYPWFPLSGWIYQQWCVRFEYGKHVQNCFKKRVALPTKSCYPLFNQTECPYRHGPGKNQQERTADRPEAAITTCVNRVAGEGRHERKRRGKVPRLYAVDTDHGIGEEDH